MHRYSRIRRAVLSLATAGTLAACAAMEPPSVPRVTQVPATPATVAERVTKEMQALGFVVTQAGGTGVIEGTSAGAPAGWAYCPAAFVTNPDGRRQKEFPVSLSDGSVQVTLSPAQGGTRVHVASSFTGSFFDGATGYTDSSSCHSEGVVEGRLLQAAQG